MSKSVTVTPITTSVYRRGEDFHEFLKLHLTGLDLENKTVAITSKIVSISENRLVSKAEISKRDLVLREADHYLGEGGYGAELTIKQGLLIPSAGIDESNSETGDYILYPENPYDSAHRIWKYLRSEFSLNKLGVILTDSHTQPLRLGVTGVALSHWGIKATRSLVDAPDLFARNLKFTHVDVIDALAGMAVFVMGESNDCMPLAIIEGASTEFTQVSSRDEIVIRPELDIYHPIFKQFL